MDFELRITCRLIFKGKFSACDHKKSGPIPVHCFHLAQQLMKCVKFASGFFNLGSYLKLIYLEVK